MDTSEDSIAEEPEVVGDDDRRSGIDRRSGEDRRIALRRKTLRSGRTFWGNSDSSECLVHNMSETGAQLRLSGPYPNEFWLAIEGEAVQHLCTVVWRTGERAGVKFSELRHADRPVADASPVASFSKIKNYADECLALAEVVDPEHRETLRQMAEA
jgi:hypothetical protein